MPSRQRNHGAVANKRRPKFPCPEIKQADPGPLHERQLSFVKAARNLPVVHAKVYQGKLKLLNLQSLRTVLEIVVRAEVLVNGESLPDLKMEWSWGYSLVHSCNSAPFEGHGDPSYC
jgi:hypothetical protein